MAKFEPKKGKPKGEIEPSGGIPSHIPQIIEPRCNVCTHEYRRVIDRLIAQGTTSHSELGRMFHVDRRSISNHAKEHLSYEESAIRQIVADEAAKAEADIEEGIKGVVTRRVYLQAALHKALEALLNGDITVEPKDALAIIQQLDKLDSNTEGAAVDEIRVQFNAFVQAIREVAPTELWHQILERTQELLNESEDPPELASG